MFSADIYETLGNIKSIKPGFYFALAFSKVLEDRLEKVEVVSLRSAATLCQGHFSVV